MIIKSMIMNVYCTLLVGGWCLSFYFFYFYCRRQKMDTRDARNTIINALKKIAYMQTMWWPKKMLIINYIVLNYILIGTTALCCVYARYMGIIWMSSRFFSIARNMIAWARKKVCLMNNHIFVMMKNLY